MKRSLWSAALTAVLALGFTGLSAPAASAVTFTGNCWWALAHGVETSGPFKGWAFVANNTKTVIIIKVSEPGNTYQLRTQPGGVYHFEAASTRLTC
jgi:hypothetical protein